MKQEAICCDNGQELPLVVPEMLPVVPSLFGAVGTPAPDLVTGEEDSSAGAAGAGAGAPLDGTYVLAAHTLTDW